eukprot:GFUD01076159.1.p1 GENE.GFUD01076159.1~~GFUD01076159.1.p1  ORF type:complete len:100 (-),score=26.39 GFUD01076159.1:20-319(-)
MGASSSRRTRRKNSCQPEMADFDFRDQQLSWREDFIKRERCLQKACKLNLLGNTQEMERWKIRAFYLEMLISCDLEGKFITSRPSNSVNASQGAGLLGG